MMERKGEAVTTGGLGVAERSALSALYSMHVRTVTAVVRRRLARSGLVPSDHVADLVQEVFLKALSITTRSGLDPQRGYESLLVVIARNVATDSARRAVRDFKKAQLVAHVAEATDAESKNSQWSSLVSAAALYEQHLAPDLAPIHQLRFVESLPQRRVAELLGISRQRVRTLERRVVEGLRRRLEMG